MKSCFISNKTISLQKKKMVDLDKFYSPTEDDFNVDPDEFAGSEECYLNEVYRHNDFVLYEICGELSAECAVNTEDIQELFPRFVLDDEKYYCFSKGDKYYFS